MKTIHGLLLACLAVLPFASGSVWADTQNPPETVTLGSVEVTATPIPEHQDTVPQTIQVFTHAQLVALGATDLRSALSLAAGVNISPGGDGGPASAIPEFQGLVEFDAFLLLVDGVPVGGAFNPNLASIDLNDVSRIEVIQGSAPVKYGATSFVGVINIIHRKAGAPGSNASVLYGSYGSSSISIASPITSSGPVLQSIAADYTQQNFSDPRTSYSRSHLLYRSAVDTSSGEFHLDLDGLILNQKPASPRPLPDGANALSPLVPTDANNNPSDAKMDQNRVNLVLGYNTDLGWGTWTTTLANTFTHYSNIRGFIRSDQLTDNGAPNADGFNQTQDFTDIYLDSHVTFSPVQNLKLATGFSYLYGNGQEQSANFQYFIAPSGINPPPSTSVPVDEYTTQQDTRRFFGLYAQSDWSFAPRWDFNFGLQLNHDVESVNASQTPTDPSLAPQSGSDSRSDTRFSGIAALGYTAWQEGVDNTLIYANYRNTFKPAANDLGPEYDPTILQPETAQAYEAGLKGTLLQGGLDWDASAFWTNMNNTVISTDVNGLPGTANGGQDRFKGINLSADWNISTNWRWQLAYSYHDTTYRNFTDLTPNGLVQVAGNRLEMSPLNLFSSGIFYMPPQGWTGMLVVRYVGSRYFDPENTVSTPAYVTYDAGIGYRFSQWTLRLDGRNLNNQRPPVSNSELGNSQSYILPARYLELSASVQL
ncbi:MAG: TonB-dependent receptor [Gammaproteobacteria bacterium]|nr:TonB-dependent receptor [Gammaproteobacteria bacterium]